MPGFFFLNCTFFISQSSLKSSAITAWSNLPPEFFAISDTFNQNDKNIIQTNEMWEGKKAKAYRRFLILWIRPRSSMKFIRGSKTSLSVTKPRHGKYPRSESRYSIHKLTSMVTYMQCTIFVWKLNFSTKYRAQPKPYRCNKTRIVYSSIDIRKR